MTNVLTNTFSTKRAKSFNKKQLREQKANKLLPQKDRINKTICVLQIILRVFVIEDIYIKKNKNGTHSFQNSKNRLKSYPIMLGRSRPYLSIFPFIRGVAGAKRERVLPPLRG
jgi:hypothetical protein